jgi:phosphoribosylamine--glycine ligase
MRFLGIGDTCDLAALYHRLTLDGHEVRMSVTEPMCHGILAGMVERVEAWEDQLDWVQAAGQDGVILFENVAQERGALQDRLRRDGYNVIGGSALGDRLENDRAFAQMVLASLGLQTADTWSFGTLQEGLALLDARPRRYVLKWNGQGFGAYDNYVGRLPDGRDVRAVLAAKFRQFGRERLSYILMDYIEGVEMGVGAYFDGQRFLEPACLDWEHKRFFPGDLGELTGEMGTVATYDRSGGFFSRTLKKTEGLLRDAGYFGYVNLNTIVNADGIWPLEFTCRFGYPGFAVLEPLQETRWAELFRNLVTRAGEPFRTRPGYSVGVVMTTPPFPSIRRYVDAPIGVSILFDGALTAKDAANLHFGEVALDEAGELVTSGYHGWTMVITGTGTTVAAAQASAYALADRAIIPNVRYRRDIGAKLIAGDLAVVERLGHLAP